MFFCSVFFAAPVFGDATKEQIQKEIEVEVKAWMKAGLTSAKNFPKVSHLTSKVALSLKYLGALVAQKDEAKMLEEAKGLSIELISDIQTVSKEPNFGSTKDSLLKVVNDFIAIVEKNEIIVSSVISFFWDFSKMPIAGYLVEKDKDSILKTIDILNEHFDKSLHTICTRFANKIKNDTSVDISAKERAYLVRTVKALPTDFKNEEVAILISSKTSSIREEIKNYDLVGEQITEDQMEKLVEAFSNQDDEFQLININTSMWSYLHGYVQAVALMMEKENQSRSSDLKPHRAEPSTPRKSATPEDAARVLELIEAAQ